MKNFSAKIIKKALSCRSKLKVIYLHGDGEESKPEKETCSNKSEIFYPVVLDDTIWTEDKQIESAEKWKDKIKRVFDPSSVPPEKKNMLQDDLRRIEITKGFLFGKKVLEFGCSDGTISMCIAKNPNVMKVTGVDIRKSAIEDANELKKELLTNGFFNEKEESKLDFIQTVGGINTLKKQLPKMDTVCAFEVLEHIHPNSMIEIFEALYHLLKRNGNMFVSVPNRYPNEKYVKEGRHRWPWYDHKNFFSKISLELFLKEYFTEVTFVPLYDNEMPHESIYLICECKGKKK